MNANLLFAKGLADVSSHWDEGKYDRALKRVSEMRKNWPGNAHLPVLFAKLVQLQDGPTHTLDDAKRALRQAVELDASSPAAAIELGYFLDNVEDDTPAAAKAFARGIGAARQLLIEGLLGYAGALIQLDEREEAVRSLIEAHRLADAEPSSKKRPFAARIEELLVELGQTQTV